LLEDTNLFVTTEKTALYKTAIEMQKETIILRKCSLYKVKKNIDLQTKEMEDKNKVIIILIRNMSPKK
jgi:hypothetical protein